jgi:RNA polymerase sigma-70 factor, ECF subfamily
MRSYQEALTAHIDGLRRYARIYARSADEADDLVQEALVRTLERTSMWHPIRNTKAYLFRTLRNVHLNRSVQDKRYVNGVAFDQIEDVVAGPPIQYLRLQIRDVTAALLKLSTEQREILLLVGVEGLTYEEAGSVLDVPVGTVMSRLSRAREALRQLLAESQAPAAQGQGETLESPAELVRYRGRECRSEALDDVDSMRRSRRAGGK